MPFALLFLDVGFFTTEMLFLVHSFEIDGNDKGSCTKASEYNQRHGVVVRDEGVTAGLFSSNHCRIVGIGAFEHFADEHGNEAKTYVLHPENQAICAAEVAGIHDFWNAWPKGCRNQSEGDAENHDGDVGNEFAMGGGQYKGKYKVADDE